MGLNEGAGFKDFRSCGESPFHQLWGDDQWNSGRIEARQLMRVAQSAILSGLVFVPVDKDEGKADQHQNCDGASKQ